MTDSTAVSLGLLDTSVVVDFELISEENLPERAAISTVTIGELAAGPHSTRDPLEQAIRLQRLHWAETSFDALPYDLDAAHAFGSACLLILSAGRKPRKYTAGIQIASVAIANGLPLYTRNPKDFQPLSAFLDIISV